MIKLDAVLLDCKDETEHNRVKSLLKVLAIRYQKKSTESAWRVRNQFETILNIWTLFENNEEREKHSINLIEKIFDVKLEAKPNNILSLEGSSKEDIIGAIQILQKISNMKRRLLESGHQEFVDLSNKLKFGEIDWNWFLRTSLPNQAIQSAREDSRNLLCGHNPALKNICLHCAPWKTIPAITFEKKSDENNESQENTDNNQDEEISLIDLPSPCPLLHEKQESNTSKKIIQKVIFNCETNSKLKNSMNQTISQNKKKIHEAQTKGCKFITKFATKALSKGRSFCFHELLLNNCDKGDGCFWLHDFPKHMDIGFCFAFTAGKCSSKICLKKHMGAVELNNHFRKQFESLLEYCEQCDRPKDLRETLISNRRKISK